MANWAVVFRYKPNPHTVDNIIHLDFIDTKKEYVETLLRKLYKYGEYLEVLDIVSAKVWNKRILKAQAEGKKYNLEEIYGKA